MALLGPICKVAIRVTRVCDLIPAMRRAFAEARSGTPGPCYVEMPIDTLYSYMELSSNMGLMERKRAKDMAEEDYADLIIPDLPHSRHRNSSSSSSSNSSRPPTPAEAKAYTASRRPLQPCFLNRQAKGAGGFVGLYMKVFRARLFGGAFAPVPTRPLPIVYPRPTASMVSAAARLLADADRPVVIVGSQALLSGIEGGKALAAALEELGVPMFLGGMARGLMGPDSHLHIRQNRRNALRNADVVILLGMSMDFRLDYGRTLSRKSKVIAVNRSRFHLYQNADLFWSPAQACLADPHEFALDLVRAMRERRACQQDNWDVWADALRAEDAVRDARNAKKADAVAEGHGDRAGEALVNPLGKIACVYRRVCIVMYTLKLSRICCERLARYNSKRGESKLYVLDVLCSRVLTHRILYGWTRFLYVSLYLCLLLSTPPSLPHTPPPPPPCLSSSLGW